MVKPALYNSVFCRYKNCTKQKQSQCDGYCIAHYRPNNNLPPSKAGRRPLSYTPIPDVALSSLPLPVISSSSVSSASSTQKNNSSGGTSSAKRASFAIDSTDTSIVSKATSADKNKLDKKWTCPKCRGDVRSPPQHQNCDDGDQEWAKHSSIIVTCPIKGCSAPRYHVSALS